MSREQYLMCLDAPPISEVTPNKPAQMPMMTFPPCAMVYTQNNNSQKSPVDDSQDTHGNVPMDLIAKALTHPAPSRVSHRTFICLRCKDDITFCDKETQANMSRETCCSPTNGYSGLRVHKPQRTQTLSSDLEPV